MHQVFGLLSNPEDVLSSLCQGVSTSMTDKDACAQFLFQTIYVSIDRSAVNVQRFGGGADGSQLGDIQRGAEFSPSFHIDLIPVSERVLCCAFLHSICQI